MAKNDGVVGIYAAHGKMIFAMIKGKDIKSAWVDVPDNIVKNGEIVSKNLLAQLIKDTLKEHGIRTKKSAFVIAGDQVLIRDLKVPKMTEEQLRYNLPFEFRDFIRGELKDYLFDYAYRPALDGETPSQDEGLNLLGVAIPAAYYNTLNEITQMAGLKLVKAQPEVCVLEAFLKKLDSKEERNKERCFLDIGNTTTRMQVFKNGRYKLSHIIDIGEKHIVQTIADHKNVDMELARTYLRTNFEDCTNAEEVKAAYRDISVEILKGFNFYEMSDMSSRLADVVLYGSGANIAPLVEILKERLGMNVVTMAELYSQYNGNDNLNITADAIGVLFE